MARRHSEAPSLSPLLLKDDLYGRRSIVGMRDYVTNAVMRHRTTDDLYMNHVPKNGINDPITFYHIVDALLFVQPETPFRTVDFMEVLNARKRNIAWDATTVGRVLTDIAVSLHESYGNKPLDYVRRYNGMTYSVRAHPEFRVMVLRLLEDLRILGNQLIEEERRGEAPARQMTPMARCPSVAR
jgi:hypothetical protein